jgi:hypothetical protein
MKDTTAIERYHNFYFKKERKQMKLLVLGGKK